MNWMIIGPLSRPNHTAWSIIRALHSLEEEVYAVESREWNAETTTTLALSTLKSRKIDIILLVDRIPEVFTMIPNSYAYKKVFWYFDFDPLYERKMKLSLSMADFFLSMSPKIVEANKNLCKNSFFMPQAADHFLYKPISGKCEPKFELSFIGGKKRGRIERLQPLKKFDLHIFGEHWEDNTEFNVHKAVYANDFNETCANSKILLNLTRYDDFETPERTISQRIFMIMATKAFCLTEEVEGLDYFFNKDEIAVGINPNNVEFWLKSDAAREQIAENSYRKVLTCHTYIHRMKQIIKLLT